MKILRHTEQRRWWVGLLGLNEGAESQQLARVSRQIKGKCGGILTSLRFSSELFCFSAILSSTRLLSKKSIYELVNAINLHHPNPHHNTLSYMWWVGRRGLLRYSHFRADKLKTLIHVHFGFGLGLGHKHRANLFINGSILVLNRVKLVLDDLILSLLDGQCFTRLDQLLELWGGGNAWGLAQSFIAIQGSRCRNRVLTTLVCEEVLVDHLELLTGCAHRW